MAEFIRRSYNPKNWEFKDPQIPCLDYLFELPSQVKRREDSRAAGERSLMFELLASALHDLSSRCGVVKGDALEWIRLGDVGYVTCRDCCDFMGIDYGLLRQKVSDGLKLERALRGGRDAQTGSPMKIGVNNQELERSWKKVGLTLRELGHGPRMV